MNARCQVEPVSRYRNRAVLERPRRDLRFYAGLLLRRSGLLAGLTSSALFLAWIVISSLERQYEAEALVLLNPGYSSLATGTFGVDVKRTAQSFETVEAALLTRAFARRALDELGLWEDPELNGAPAQNGRRTPFDRLRASAAVFGSRLEEWASEHPYGRRIAREVFGDRPEVEEVDPQLGEDPAPVTDIERDRLVSRFLSRLSVRFVADTNLVRIGYRSRDPEFAASTANAVVEAYTGKVLSDRLRIVQSSRERLERRVVELNEMLKTAQREVDYYKTAKGLVTVRSRVEQLNEQSLLILNRQLIELRTNYSSKLAELRSLEQSRERPDELLVSGTVARDPLVVRAQQDMAGIRTELAELRTRYGENHPRVRDALSSLYSIQTSLEEHIERVIATLDAEVRGLRSALLESQKRVSEQENELRRIAGNRSGLEALEEEVLRISRLRDRFLRGAVTSRTSARAAVDDMRLVDGAVVPSAPVYPRDKPMFAVVLFMALLGSFLLAILLEQLDDSVRGVAEAEEKFGLPVLGILPLAPRRRRKRREELPVAPADYAQRSSALSDALSFTQIALMERQAMSSARTLLVTSSVPGEGRTTMAMNLAWSFARSGRRVLLVEADLRRPVLARTMGVSRRLPGVAEVVVGTVSLEKAIVRDARGYGFDVLVAGAVSDNRSGYAMSERFGELVARAAKEYDFILIDSPPVLAAADPLALSRWVDAVFFLVRSHHTREQLVHRALKRLIGVSAPVVGLGITRVDLKRLARYGADRGFLGYFDRYGYSRGRS